MNEDIRLLNEKLDRLRHDLSATTSALVAMAANMPPEQLQRVLTTMARESSEKQTLYEQAATPKAQQAGRQAQEAEERMYLKLQKAPQYPGPG
jgi:hypothetical protein